MWADNLNCVGIANLLQAKVLNNLAKIVLLQNIMEKKSQSQNFWSKKKSVSVSMKVLVLSLIDTPAIET